MSDLARLSPEMVKQMNKEELCGLCSDVRQLIIRTVSENGGHLASNLGVVELTVALHRSFDFSSDRILWDVGHQCYTHKIITGRGEGFSTLRKKDGLSGFPKPCESEQDAFIAGHSSSSISIAHGMASADKLSGNDRYTVCVIGDGAIAGGMAFEALNNCARSYERLIIVLNDNEMSIGKSVGAMAKYFTRLRNGNRYFKFKDSLARFLEKIPLVGRGLKRVSADFKDRMRDLFLHDNIFQKMGLVYLGPIDGHDISRMTDLFTRAKQLNKPVLIHVNTVKGKGYEFAENSPDRFHGLGHFDISTGTCEQNSCDSYSEIFGKELVALAEKDESICAVSAAMVKATGLSNMPEDRLFDVGMAEEHAVSFTAGLAANKMKPVCAIYSSFLQRAYDQINQDICLANTHAVLCVDRAGIVGEDGETHQGMFDVGFLTPLPNMTVYSPGNRQELVSCLNKALYEHTGPVTLRYPRGEAAERREENRTDHDGFSLYTYSQDKENLIVTYGRETQNALKTCCDVLSLWRIKPISPDAIKLASEYKNILFAEEGMLRGGISEAFLARLNENGFKGKYKAVGADDTFIKQATVEQSIKALKLDGESLTELLGEMK